MILEWIDQLIERNKLSRHDVFACLVICKTEEKREKRKGENFMTRKTKLVVITRKAVSKSKKKDGAEYRPLKIAKMSFSRLVCGL